jgi:hypothetical protein
MTIPFTPKEDAIVIALPPKQASWKLLRPIREIYHRRVQLGVSDPSWSLGDAVKHKHARRNAELILQWKSEGKSFTEIGKLLGVSRQRVHQIWKEETK